MKTLPNSLRQTTVLGASVGENNKDVRTKEQHGGLLTMFRDTRVLSNGDIWYAPFEILPLVVAVGKGVAQV